MWRAIAKHRVKSNKMLQRARSFMVRHKKTPIEEEPDLSETAHLRRPRMPKFLEHRRTFQSELYDIPQMDRRNPLKLRENQSIRRQSISLDDMMRVGHFSSRQSTENAPTKYTHKPGEIRHVMHNKDFHLYEKNEEYSEVNEDVKDTREIYSKIQV